MSTEYAYKTESIEKRRELAENEDVRPHIENPHLREEFGELLEKSETVNHQVSIELINTRLWIDELSKKYQKPMTIDTIPDAEWQEFFETYDMFWFMGIYTPSEASREHAKKYADQYKYALPDIDREKDITASPFAVPEYTPNPQIAANWESWDAAKKKLNEHKKKVIVDFVPNHTALDHPWAKEHPEYYILGTEAQYQKDKNLYYSVAADDGKTYYIAHGKDPGFSEWSDTLQLNYANPAVHEEMKNVLRELLRHADGVRCDMAMLIDADTFIRTWGSHLTEEQKQYIKQHEFWRDAIPVIKEEAKKLGREDFYFIAEAYWDKEELDKQFDYIYEKDFYDQLLKVEKGEISAERLKSYINYLITFATKERHSKAVLFLENHDEERSMKMFGKEASEAAAVLVGFVPNSLFVVNQGQTEGRKIRPPMQISRWPEEPHDEELETYYKKLLLLKHTALFQNGEWKMVELSAGFSSIQAMQVVSYEEDTNAHERGAVILINFSGSDAECRVPSIGANSEIEVQSMSRGVIQNPDMERQGGLYVGLQPWETQIVFYSKNLKKEE